MGGGGGNIGNGSPPKELMRRLQESENETQRDVFETEVADIIDEQLEDIEARDVEAIRKHLDTIKEAIDDKIEGTVDLLFGGSVQKHTFVDGLSDVDALVKLNDSELCTKTPQEVKDYLSSRLQERLSDTKVTAGNLAVTVAYTDIDVQLVPAIKCGEKYKIPDRDGNKWAEIETKVFTDQLTDLNKKLSSKLIPSIKLIKSIMGSLPENCQLSGYHVEALCVNMFESYSDSVTTKAMVNHFFQQVPSHIMQPVVDQTGQSSHIDEYLGSSSSKQRKAAADSIARIGRKMRNADTIQSVQQWQEIVTKE